MNLQKRIFWLNMGMLVISLLAMLGISIYVANNIYQNQGAWQSTSQKTAISQTALEGFSGTDFTRLAEELAATGAQLHVMEGDWVVYSNLQEEEADLLSVQISATTHTTYVDEGIVISREIVQSGVPYQLYVFLEDDEEEHEAEEYRAFLLQIVVIGGSGIFLIVGLNLLFTRRILRAILLPLDELRKGVERIQRGDYQTPLTYQGDREFEELTQGFNQMQETLLEAEETTRQYERNRTQLVADISHDLRTPLTSIKGYAKGILDGVANTEDKQRRYLETIYQKSKVMDQLLEKLFVFSKLETDKLPFDLVRMDLRDLLSVYAREKEGELGEQGIFFQLELPQSLPVEIDQVQFRRILDNLVDNARKYAGVRPLLLTMTGAVVQDEVVWTFADNGQGIEESQLQTIFDEFYRVDQTRQINGHGLGLSIIRNIMRRLGGRVQATNDAGLQFTFFLPRKEK